MWFEFFAFWALAGRSASQNDSLPSQKIVGGRNATLQAHFAFMASVRVNGAHICGGSVIDHRHILTAAHCCFSEAKKPFPRRSMSIAAGDLNVYGPSSVVKEVETVIIHRGYDPDGIADDIAVIRIRGFFDTRTGNVGAVFLGDFVPRAGDLCVIYGWGTTQYNTSRLPQNLLYAVVPIVSAGRCRYFYEKKVTDKVVCAGEPGKDSCQGDSGGPLICHGFLVGIVSWGSGCGSYPGVYTAVAKYAKWIRKYSDSSSSRGISTRSRHVFVVILVFVHYNA